MEKLRQLWSFVRARLGLAGGMAAAIGCGVLLLSLVCATFSYSSYGASARARFEDHARMIRQMTAASWTQGQSDIEALRLFYQLEARRSGLDIVALGAGQRVLLAGDIDTEGMSPDFALDRPGILETVEALPADGTVVTQRYAERDRIESLMAFPLGSGAELGWLYLGVDARVVDHEAWLRFKGVMSIGCVLAAGATMLVFMMLQKGLVGPLRILERRVRSHDRSQPPLDSGRLGELTQLANALEEATQRLVKAEEDKHSELSTHIELADQAAVVQTELVLAIVKDLRSAMFSVLGQAELLVNDEPRSADHMNYIRAIEREARRVAELADRILEVLSSINQMQPDPRQLPLAELRAVTEHLQGMRSKLEADSAATARSQMGRKLEDIQEPRETPAPIKHLSGAVLVVGRSESTVQGAVRELQGLGLEAVWVETLASCMTQLKHGNFNAVLMQVFQADTAARQAVQAVSAHFKAAGIVALLPGTARGQGELFLELGFHDHVFAPVNRAAMLAVIGKYLGFQAVEESAAGSRPGPDGVNPAE